MIQEMYAVSGLLAAEAGHPKISSTINRSIPESSAATSTTVTATAAAATSNSKSQNLRCPRCESSNTKFCYYNNYNLTQPRHFCKTCRRYWTKGGALRNVPIGGGCRKNKSAAAGKMIKTASSSTVEILGRVGSGLDREIISSPTQILWGSPQNSQLLAILRSAGARNQNPSPNNNNNNNNLAGCHVINDSSATSFQARTTMGFDPTNHISSLGLCSSYWRNSQSQVLYQPNGYVHGGGGGQVTGGGGGIQELYQKLIKSSSSLGNYFSDGQQGSMGTAAPVGGGETTGYWNPSFSLSDVHASAANGAYP